MLNIDLDKIMKDLEITQKELSEDFKVSSPAISKYKRGEMTMPKSWIEVLKNKYKVKLEDYILESPKNNTKQKMIPYYAIDVFGTPGAEIINDRHTSLKPEFFISIPELTDVDMYIRVTGDSMYPKYRHGDIIGIKELSSSLFFAWYEPYVIITRGNYQRLIKYIHPHDQDDSKILLVSYDTNKFKPQPLEKEEIYKLYSVRGKIEL